MRIWTRQTRMHGRVSWRGWGSRLEPDRQHNTEVSRRVLEITERALSLDRVTTEFLDAECGDDARLRAAVESVLQAVNDTHYSDQFVSRQIAADDPVPETIGPYRVTRKVGEGGMGTVFEAVRAHEDYEQRVAVKVVRGLFLNADMRARFATERRILAALGHPYVAALLDGGTTPDGVPYFVMEYVDGEPLDQYCDARKLDVDERLDLLQKVFTAVQAAHQNLVVHRDLKPSNVLVTVDGIPKLLDFGVAKLLSDDGPGRGATTVGGVVALTPDYASPEQILGEHVTTVSDVYSLGVLAYQLLTGRLPYRVDASSPGSMVDAVNRLAVAPPSTAIVGDEVARLCADRSTTPRRLARRLRGDLDTIVLKALRREPRQRYASVAELSHDVAQFLAGLPIRARGESLGYRASRFLRRHWIGAGAAALLLITLLAGVAATLTQAGIAQTERDAARQAAADARNTVEFLKSVLFAGDPWAGGRNERTVADVLQYAEDNLAAGYREQPITRASVLTALSEVHAARGDHARALDLAADAVALVDEDTGGAGDAIRADVYRAHALALYYVGQYEQSARRHEEAIALYVARNPISWIDLARAQDHMGLVQMELAQEADAERYLHAALESLDRSGVDDVELLVTITSNTAVLYLQQGRYEGAAARFHSAIGLAEEAPTIGDARVGMLYANYAGVQMNLEDWDAALVNYRRAIELQNRSLGSGHPESIVTVTTFGNLQQRMGLLDNAFETLRAAYASAAGLPDDHWALAYVQNVFASVLCRTGHGREGLPHAEASLAARRATMPDGHWAIASGEGVLGTCHVAVGDFETAEQLLLGAHAKLLEARGPEHDMTRNARGRLRELYVAWNRPDHATRFSER